MTADSGRITVTQTPTLTTQWLSAALLAATISLSACSDSDAGDSSSKASTTDTKATNALLDTLEKNQSNLSLSGTVNSTGERTTVESYRDQGRFINVFRPASSRSKNPQARRGSNAEGPYAFRIYTDAIHDDDSEHVVPGWIQITLPENASPGSYRVAALRDSKEDDVQAAIVGDGYGWQFTRDISGTMDIVEIGEQLTAAWDFEAHGAGETSTHATGAVKALPFTPQQEATFTLRAGDEVIEHFGSVTSQWKGDRHTLLLGSGVYLDLPAQATEGTYRIRHKREADTVRLTLPKYDFEDVDGKITLETDGQYLNGNYTLTATGKDNVKIDGTLNHVKIEKS